MGKLPAFQFYVRDWLSDPQLRMAAHSTKGIWTDFLCFMWEAPERGILSGTKEQLRKMVGATEADFDLFLSDAEQLQFCDISVTCHAESQNCHAPIIIKNRRMFREEKIRKNARLRKQKQREKESDTDESQESHKKVTPPSSFSSSKKKINKRKNRTQNTTPCPDIFPITERMKTYAQVKKFQGDLEDLTEGFLLYHRKKGSCFVDWYAAWQTWLRNAMKWESEKTDKPAPKIKYVRAGDSLE